MADPFLDQIMGSAVWEGSGKTRGCPLWQFSVGFSVFHLLYPENVSLFNCHALGKELAVIICLFLCSWNRPSAWYLLALVPQIFGRKEKLPAAMTHQLGGMFAFTLSGVPKDLRTDIFYRNKMLMLHMAAIGRVREL